MDSSGLYMVLFFLHDNRLAVYARRKHVQNELDCICIESTHLLLHTSARLAREHSKMTQRKKRNRRYHWIYVSKNQAN